MIRIDRMPYFSLQLGAAPDRMGMPLGFMLTIGSWGVSASWAIYCGAAGRRRWTPEHWRTASVEFFRVWPKGFFGRWPEKI